MATLKTNYKDDILNTSVNTQRKYRMVNNADGTISLEDVTVYTQNGDTFGAADVNKITAKINEQNNNLANVKTSPDYANAIDITSYCGTNTYGSVYSAPSDGFLHLYGISPSASVSSPGSIVVKDSDSNMYWSNNIYVSNRSVSVDVLASKGDKFYIAFHGTEKTNCLFVPYK